MKTQLFFCVFLTALLACVRAESDESEEDWSSEEEECVNEHKLNKAEIQALNAEILVPENNTDFNTYIGCYWKKLGALDDKGAIDINVVQKEFIDEYKKIFGKNPDIPSIIAGGLIKTAITKCGEKHVEGSSHGETAAKLQNCVVEKVVKDVEEGGEGNEEETE